MKTLGSTSSKGVIKRKSGFGMGFFKTHSPIKLLNKTKKAPIVTFASPTKLSPEMKDKKKALSSDFLIPIRKSGIKKKSGVSHWNQREAIKTLIITSKQSNSSEDETDKHIANIEIKAKDLFNLKSEILHTKSKLKSKTKVKSKLYAEHMDHNSHHHHHHHHHLSNSRKLFRIQQQQATPLSSDDSTRRESMPSMSKTNLTSPFNCIPSPFQMTPSPLNLSRQRLPSSLYNNHFGPNTNTLTPSEPNASPSPFTDFELKDNDNILFNKNDTQLDDDSCKEDIHRQNIFKRYQDFDLQSPTPVMPKKMISLSSSGSLNKTKPLFEIDSDPLTSSPYNQLKNTSKNSYEETSTSNITHTSTMVSSTPKVTDIFSSPTPTPTPATVKVSNNEVKNFISTYQCTDDLLESPSPSLFSYPSQVQPLSSSPIPSSPLASFNNENTINSYANSTTSSPSDFSDFKINKCSNFSIDFIKDQIENNLVSPTPSTSQFLRRSKSMIEGCNNYFKNPKPLNEVKNKDGFILLSPTPVAPRRRKALFSMSSIDSIASTSEVKDNEDEKNHDTKTNKDDSNLDSPSSSSSESYSKCFPKRICRTYSECSLQYLKNWKDASSFGHGEDSILPCDSGKDSLRRISATTLSKLLQGKYKGLYDEYHIIDCRFPYEYEGGHICNAKNINDPATLYNLFFNKEDYSKKVIIIFHCEFSSERAPWMAQFFRKADREKNRFFYPRLHYPEVYVLKGGYKEFYNNYKEFCSPQKYVEMADAKYIEQCKHHRKMFKKAKSTSELYYSSKYQHQEDESFNPTTTTTAINDTIEEFN